jgi:hypothetical protein
MTSMVLPPFPAATLSPQKARLTKAEVIVIPNLYLAMIGKKHLRCNVDVTALLAISRPAIVIFGGFCLPQDRSLEFVRLLRLQ